MSEQLEIVAHGVTAILAIWLGLIVVTRAGRRPGARVFAMLTACLVVWSVAIIVQRLTRQPETVGVPLNAIEDVAAFLLPAATLHIALVLAVEGRRSPLQQAMLIATYAVSGVMALGAVFFPEQQLQVTPPHLVIPGIPGESLGWAWIVARIMVFGAAVYWIARALSAAGADQARRGQLLAALATVMVGATGGILRFLPGPADNAPWIGVSLVSLAVVLAAYAVFAQGVFLPADVAARAFRYSLVVGVGVTLYVAAVLGLERLTQEFFAIDLPIVTALSLVITLALFDPVGTWLRQNVRARNPREAAGDRLRQALGMDIVTGQPPESAVAPALARLIRTFRMEGALVETLDGEVIAQHGRPQPDSPLAIRIPLRGGEEELGSVLFGPKRSQLPFASHEIDLLSTAASFVAASLQLGERHDAQGRGAGGALSRWRRGAGPRGHAERGARRRELAP